jgi:hypothetical protein
VRPRSRGVPRVLRERLRLLAHGAPPPKHKRSPEEVLASAREEVSAIVAGDGPVVAGPWLGEVGYELLYWIPFLRWATREHPGLRERLVVVSRGGVASWYTDVASRYAEIFELASLEELAAWRAEPQIVGEDLPEPGAPPLAPRKSRRLTRGDQALLDRAAGRLGIADWRPLHPSTYFKLMYRLRDLGVWSDVEHVSAFTQIEPPLAEIELPERFVAMRLYASTALSANPHTRVILTEIANSLAEHVALVDIDTGLREDDHFALAAVPATVRLADLGIPPARNLSVQTAVVARAEGFVGTYGGLSYLPPLLGVPSLALYSNPAGFFHQHLSRAERLFSQAPWGGFTAVGIGSRDALELLSLALTTTAAGVGAPFRRTDRARG